MDQPLQMENIVRILVTNGQMLAVAESCTGGDLAAVCTSYPGASEWFAGGVIAYNHAIKQRLLQVSEADLAAHGAVSEQVAMAMAKGVINLCQVDIGLSITGVAGPDRQGDDPPVGTVCLALVVSEHQRTVSLQLSGDRQQIRTQAVARVLAELSALLGLVD